MIIYTYVYNHWRNYKNIPISKSDRLINAGRRGALTIGVVGELNCRHLSPYTSVPGPKPNKHARNLISYTESVYNLVIN